MGAQRGHGAAGNDADEQRQRHAQQRDAVGLGAWIAEQHLADQRRESRGEHGEIDELGEGLPLNARIDEHAQHKGQQVQRVHAVEAEAHRQEEGGHRRAGGDHSGQEHHGAADGADDARVQAGAGDAAELEEEIVLRQNGRLSQNPDKAAEDLVEIRSQQRPDVKGHGKAQKHEFQDRAVALFANFFQIHNLPLLFCVNKIRPKCLCGRISGK